MLPCFIPFQPFFPFFLLFIHPTSLAVFCLCLSSFCYFNFPLPPHFRSVFLVLALPVSSSYVSFLIFLWHSPSIPLSFHFYQSTFATLLFLVIRLIPFSLSPAGPCHSFPPFSLSFSWLYCSHDLFFCLPFICLPVSVFLTFFFLFMRIYLSMYLPVCMSV